VYSLIRPLLFSLDAERAHDCTLRALRVTGHVLGGTGLLRAASGGAPPSLPVDLLGRRFPNPVGLAAGLDKDGCCAGALHALGFGFVELGTVTPRPQPGNPRPRLFRLAAHDAIINRMGFNSGGLAAFVDRLRARPRRGLIGINLGKNKDTPAERALDDYVAGLHAVYAQADYVTVNISSPNTPGLRDLQEETTLAALLAGLKAEQGRLSAVHSRYVPLALKIAPDLDDNAIDAIARLLLDHHMDVVIATNTTVARPGLDREPQAREAGGLSGAPLRALATQVVRRLYATLQGRVPIIGVGGIFTAEHAWERLVAGAELVQIYSALIYRGPGVVREIVTGLANRVRASGGGSLSEAVRRARSGAIAGDRP
jgi:dihydroorotate dehydrogenase